MTNNTPRLSHIEATVAQLKLDLWAWSEGSRDTKQNSQQLCKILALVEDLLQSGMSRGELMQLVKETLKSAKVV